HGAHRLDLQGIDNLEEAGPTNFLDIPRGICGHRQALAQLESDVRFSPHFRSNVHSLLDARLGLLVRNIARLTDALVLDLRVLSYLDFFLNQMKALDL